MEPEKKNPVAQPAPEMELRTPEGLGSMNSGLARIRSSRRLQSEPPSYYFFFATFFTAFLTAAFGFAAAFVAAGFFAFFFATIGIAITPSTEEVTPCVLVHQHIGYFASIAQHFVLSTVMHERHAITNTR